MSRPQSALLSNQIPKLTINSSYRPKSALEMAEHLKESSGILYRNNGLDFTFTRPLSRETLRRTKPYTSYINREEKRPQSAVSSSSISYFDYQTPKTPPIISLDKQLQLVGTCMEVIPGNLYQTEKTIHKQINIPSHPPSHRIFPQTQVQVPPTRPSSRTIPRSSPKINTYTSSQSIVLDMQQPSSNVQKLSSSYAFPCRKPKKFHQKEVSKEKRQAQFSLITFQ
ncbi:hypothetical protein RCL1_004612 [Eukaryota sp. TZLM3-RCL]